jgi:hypothetical protein
MADSEISIRLARLSSSLMPVEETHRGSVLGNSVPRRAWRPFGAIRRRRGKLANCSRRSTAGSPKASTRSISERLRLCSMSWRHERLVFVEFFLPKAATTSFFFMRAAGSPRSPRLCSSVPSPIMPGCTIFALFSLSLWGGDFFVILRARCPLAMAKDAPSEG